jgi:hypothetical protein
MNKFEEEIKMIKELRKTIEQARVEVDPTSEEGDKTK